MVDDGVPFELYSDAGFVRENYQIKLSVANFRHCNCYFSISLFLLCIFFTCVYFVFVYLHRRSCPL